MRPGSSPFLGTAGQRYFVKTDHDLNAFRDVAACVLIWLR
jgi:hypothetical protein